MSIFKCKMCGGALEINGNETVATCEYCGTQQTLPKLDDDRRANMYDRANHFRRNNDYDKAMGIYEQILNEDNTDAEAYWSLVLCRYGIEYVQDPASHKRIPTVNRAQFTSVFADENYKSALQYADTLQKSIYEAEAKAIDEIQKGILEISQKEEPFDVFICYKETDANGRRTPDSVLATELYHELTKAGYKVFFARITLEDKLGTAYEPYIFAALHSAKVMVVLGTKAEYFNAVWVKNEWSRYLALIQNGEKKTLIPAYKDMDPYDLPEAFSHLQAQDMSKLGFMQDLLHGIKKILGSDENPQKETVVVQAAAPASSNYSGLLKRAYIFLEDGKWQEADEYCEKVLDSDPECAEAYLGKLLASLHISKRNNLKSAAEPFDSNDNCKKASRYDANLAKELADINTYIRERNENARKERIYQNAINDSARGTEEKLTDAMLQFKSIPGYKDAEQRAKQCRKKAEQIRQEKAYQKATAEYEKGTETGYKEAEKIFALIPGYKDADYKKAECPQKAEICRKETIYQKAFTALKESNSILRLEDAQMQLASISDYKDAQARVDECKKKIEEIKAEAEAKAEQAAKKRKKAFAVGTPILCAIIAFVIVLNTVIIPNGKYKDAIALMDAEKYSEAISVFQALDGYKDSMNKIEECNAAILDGKYNDAIALMDAEKYSEAISAFQALDGYKDCMNKIEECNALRYDDAIALMDAGKVGEAFHIFGKLGDYKDAKEKAKSCGREYSQSITGLLAAGDDHTVGLRADGTVVATEYTDDYYRGQCDVDGWTDIVALAAGDNHTVGLRADGTVVATGDNGSGRCAVDGWTDIVALAAGGWHTVGLRADGTVVATGSNDDGQCAVDGWTDIVALAAGWRHTVGLRADGTVVAAGDNGSSWCDVDGWTDIVAIAAGDDHTVGLRADGTVVATGSNGYGQCTVDGWTDIVALAAGWSHTVGLRADGTVVATGSNDDGQCAVDGWTDIVALAAGGFHTVGLRADGTVVATGGNGSGQCDVDGWTDIVALAAGYSHTVGLRADGTVVATGSNVSGQCDVDGWKNMKLPSADGTTS